MTDPHDDLDADVGVSADAGSWTGGPDLTPRELRPAGRRRWLPLVVIAAVVVVVLVVVVRGLGDAALYFRNVDEAVAERDDLGDRRFRLQGTVVPGSVVDTRIEGAAAVAFTVRFEGVEADVVHVGDPPQLFQPDVPVVLEGHWAEGPPAVVDDLPDGAHDGWYFASDEMLVKHDNEYVADNEERLDDADRGGGADVEDGR